MILIRKTAVACNKALGNECAVSFGFPVRGPAWLWFGRLLWLHLSQLSPEAFLNIKASALSVSLVNASTLCKCYFKSVDYLWEKQHSTGGNLTEFISCYLSA